MKTLKRALFGFLLGVLAGNVIAALFGWPDGVVTDKLLAMTGGLAPALLVQTLLSGLLGAVSFAGISLYDADSWPLLRIAVVHYLIIEAAYMPVAFALGWLAGGKEALIWLCISALCYLAIFLIMCAIYRAQVKKLNQLTEQTKLDDEQKSGGAK